MLEKNRSTGLARKRARARQTAMLLLRLELLEAQIAKRLPKALEAEILAAEVLERLRTAR